MTATNNHARLALSVDDPAARSRLGTVVDGLLAAGTPEPRLTVLLEGGELPPPIIALLVSNLRRLREVGGAIAIEPQTTDLRDALAFHGLDRVFAFPLVPDETARRQRRHRFDFRRTVVTAAALFVGALGLQPAAGDSAPAPDPAAVIARVIERNPSLSSYQGRMHVDLRLVSFPFLRQHLEATTYFKRPSNYEVVFDRIPAYARGFEKLYTDIGDPSSWERRFVVTFDGERPFEDRQDLSLHLVQRVRGMIDHETVLVDPEHWTIDEIRYDYYNGGVITMTQQFRDVGGYSLLVSQRAEIHIPHVRAIAEGTYDGYRTNVAIDDAVFERGSKQ
jgi:hypothetical protein